MLPVPTGILSEKQREFLRGENDAVKNPDQYERKLRQRARERVQQVEEDISLLEENGHDDIVAEFYHEVDRIERLRRDLFSYVSRPSSTSGSDTSGDTDG